MTKTPKPAPEPTTPESVAVAAPEPKAPAIPQRGGSYTRQPDGSLTLTKEA